MKVKKMLAIILTLSLVLALVAACGSTDEPAASSGGDPSSPVSTASPGPGTSAPPASPAPPESPPPDVQLLDTIVHQIGSQPIAVLNLLTPGSNSAPHHWAFIMMFDRLVEVDHWNNSVSSALATDWDISDNYTTFTFNLREDVVFHNGDKFTAQDVADTIRMAQRPLETDGPGGEIRPFGTLARELWSVVTEVNVLGDYRIELKLDEPDTDFILDLGHTAGSILNMAAIVANDQTGPMIGTGAYKVVDFESQSYVEFLRNDDYWGVMPLTERQIWRFTPEMPVRTVMMQNGESHFAQSLPVTDTEAIFEPDPAYGLMSNLLGGGFGIFFNMNDPITGDINFRKAVAATVDRAPIGMFVEGGGRWAILEDTGTFWGMRTRYRNNDIPIIPRDLDAAKAYLAESSYNGETVSMAAATFHQVQMANILQEQLREIGVNISIDQMEMLAMNDLMAYGNNAGQMAVMMGQMKATANSSKSSLYPEAGNNKVNYNNPDVTALFDRAVISTDQAERERLFKEIQVLVAEDLPVVMLYYRDNPIVFVAGLGGVVPPYESDGWDLRNAFVVVE